MQRGVAFSTGAAFLVSELILIVGAGYHDQLKGTDFDISLLGQFIEPYVGEVSETFIWPKGSKYY